MKILLTNLSMSSRSGTEIVSRDLARALMKRGHEVVIYSPMTGRFAEELRSAGIPVVERVKDIPFEPDIIHGHHHRELMSALLYFPQASALFVCHDPDAWHDCPPVFPRIYRYVAVGESTRQRLLKEGVDEDITRVIPNAVDLDLYKKRKQPVNKLSKALLFSHYANEHCQYPVIQSVCHSNGIELEVAGAASGNAITPEDTLINYDIVFATARSALEALACGCAVILVNPTNSGPLVSTTNWKQLYQQNFSHGALQNPITEKSLQDQLDMFDPEDVEKVTDQIRAVADIDSAVDNYLEVYQEALKENEIEKRESSFEHEIRSASAYLESHYSYSWITRARHLEKEVAHWKSSAEAAHQGWAELGEEYRQVVDQQSKT